MWNDPNWFYTDEPTAMWGRQLEYYSYPRIERGGFVRTPDQRRFSSLRLAFAHYRVGFGDKGPDDDQLEVMRRTLSWLHCGRYEQPVVTGRQTCPSVNRRAIVDDRRVICDVFGGARSLFAHYLFYLEMLRLVVPLNADSYGLTREGQSVLIMLELTRPQPGRGIDIAARSLDTRTKRGTWIEVDPGQWASGIIAIDR